MARSCSLSDRPKLLWSLEDGVAVAGSRSLFLRSQSDRKAHLVCPLLLAAADPVLQVRVAYVAWIMAASAYALNWLAITIALFSLHRTGVSMSDWFFATMVGSIGLPASWRFWCGQPTRDRAARRCRRAAEDGACVSRRFVVEICRE